MKKLIAIFVLGIIITTACNINQDNKATVQAIEKYAESLDSSGFSVYLKGALERQKVFKYMLTADVETDEVVSPPKTDAADDPAIWVNTDNPEKSLIFGTNKMGGIHVYNIYGKEMQYVQSGCMNNIDLRDGFIYNAKETVLVSATNCTQNTIDLFILDKETLTLSEAVYQIKSNVDLVYGLCMFKNIKENQFYVIVNGEGAEVEQWNVSMSDNEFTSALVREFKVSSKPEGMVVDDQLQMLYIGVEEEGILKLDADPETGFEKVWIKGSNPTDQSLISSDIEGLGLLEINNKKYLIASSQGNFSYAVFELGVNERYMGSFIISDGVIDGATETDGLDIVTDSLNEMFPNGMMVVQDGYNFERDSIQRQNFKYISCQKIEDFIRSIENN